MLLIEAASELGAERVSEGGQHGIRGHHVCHISGQASAQRRIMEKCFQQCVRVCTYCCVLTIIAVVDDRDGVRSRYVHQGGLTVGITERERDLILNRGGKISNW